MRIGLGLPPNFDVEATHGSKAERARERANAASDESSLSVDRTSIRSLQVELNNLPEIRKDKVEALRRAIANGDYRVTAESIAEAMYKQLAALS